MKCKICDSQDTRVQYRLTRANLDVLRCRSCGFTFSDYDADETRLASDGHGFEGVPDVKPAYTEKYIHHLHFLENLAGPMRGKKVLDVGAGGGGWLEAARSAGASIEGIEFCADCRSYAKEFRNIRLRTEGIQDAYWTAQSGEFDLVSAWDVIEHVVDPIGFLSGCAAAVAPGGSFVFTTPVRDTWFDRMGACAYKLSFGREQFLLRQRYSGVHLQIFHSRQLSECLNRIGLHQIYYRKVQELSFPHRQYFRNMGFSPGLARATGAVTEWTLSIIPLVNKVFGVFGKPALSGVRP